MEFREIRFFRRGKHRELFDQPFWFGFRKRPTEIEVYDDVLMFVATRFAEPGQEEQPRKRRPAQSKVRPGAVLIKYFKHIASADLNALFPNVRILMSLKDKLMLGVPALVGFIPIVLKLASTLTVLFLVRGLLSGRFRAPSKMTKLPGLLRRSADSWRSARFSCSNGSNSSARR